MEEEKLLPETLEKLIITMHDFQYAIREITPSAMRVANVIPIEIILILHFCHWFLHYLQKLQSP